ncbi:MAG: GNAT family N-acetyltransferase [Bdellovibrionales bacterium]|nr:GNAT family N-acetyltransferase [Bdellovibrionales bacterium]
MNNNFQFVKAKDKNDLERFYPVMKELRKDLSFEDYMMICKNAHEADGYEIVAIESDNKVLAVMGYRILHDFVHGKHLYIDDLVSTESHRSQGLGAKLLNYAEDIAKELGCRGLRLCTGIENEQGKKFYERHDWKLRAVAYKKKLSQI